MRNIPRLCVGLLIASSFIYGSHVYRNGTLVEVVDNKIDVGGPMLAHVSYIIRIEGDDGTYCAYIGKRRYEMEWVVGDEVAIRVKGHDLFLRRKNGQELKGEILKFIKHSKKSLSLDSTETCTPPKRN